MSLQTFIRTAMHGSVGPETASSDLNVQLVVIAGSLQQGLPLEEYILMPSWGT